MISNKTLKVILSHEEAKQTLGEELVEILQDHAVSVTFTKRDGSTREMRCTLNSSLADIPSSYSSNPKNPDEGRVTVWDLDKQGWRSFYVDTVTSIKIPAA